MNKSGDELRKLVIDALNMSSETDSLEFKDGRQGLYVDLWKPITAFSNSPGGGIIILGIKEEQSPRELKVVGNLDLDRLQENIVNLMEQRIINKSEYYLRVFECQGHNLLALIISETPRENKPCYFKDLGIDKGACMRAGNTNRQITEEELRAFLRYTPAYNFDKSVIVEISISELSNYKIEAFLEKSAKRTNRQIKNNPDNTVLKNIGVVSDNNGKILPTLAGVLIFLDRNPQDFESLSRYIIRCVRYGGNSSSSDIIDKSDVFGTLDQQVDEVLKFVLRNIKTEASIVGSKRIERYEYSEIALREVIVNAIVHRDYSNQGTYVQVSVFANRIEISNPGTLPPGVNIENLKNAQFSRNNIIAQIMRDLDYMEEFGRGIDLIYSKMSEWNLMEPLFKNVANVFKVTLFGRDFPNLNERQLRIWDYLQDRNQITAIQATSLFKNVSRTTINYDLKKMVDLELIESKGASNNTYYVPRY
jgi:ATP-dependent DNA helicase RecG